MEVKDLKALIEALDRSSLTELSLSREDGTKVVLRKSAPVYAAYPQAPVVSAPVPVVAAVPAAAASPAPAAAEAPVPAAAIESGLLEIRSPMVGTFYNSPSPEAAAFVQEGATVTKGQTVCIVEAMKLMNEIESEVAGTIVKVCVENEAAVEFGTVLFLVKP
jgi:acetyl-CoA carboxylase biotin carboxyl carrier protein